MKLFRATVLTCVGIVMTFGGGQLCLLWGQNSESLDRKGGEESSEEIVREGDRLFVKGFSGKLRLVGRPHSKSVVVKVRRVNQKINSDEEDLVVGDWSWSFYREGLQLKLLVKGPYVKSNWTFHKGGQWPVFDISIEAPPMWAEIHWQEADIHIQNWESDLLAHVFQAQIKDLKGKGNHRINIQEGALDVSGHEGELKIESFSAKVHVSGSKSAIYLENFMGVSELEGVVGDINFRSYRGLTRLVNCEGNVSFKNIHSPVRVKGLSGGVRGESQEGEVRLFSVDSAHIHIEGGGGNIHLNLPQSSGASVDLGSLKGGIHGPKFLTSYRLKGLRQKKGLLRGKKSGKVYVRTTSGSIFLK